MSLFLALIADGRVTAILLMVPNLLTSEALEFSTLFFFLFPYHPLILS
jgi:hypothetical protein